MTTYATKGTGATGIRILTLIPAGHPAAGHPADPAVDSAMDAAAGPAAGHPTGVAVDSAAGPVTDPLGEVLAQVILQGFVDRAVLVQRLADEAAQRAAGCRAALETMRAAGAGDAALRAAEDMVRCSEEVLMARRRRLARAVGGEELSRRVRLATDIVRRLADPDTQVIRRACRHASTARNCTAP